MENRRKRLKREDSAAVEALLDLNGAHYGAPSNVSFSSLGFEIEKDEAEEEEYRSNTIIRSTRKVIEDERGEVVVIKGAWSPEEDEKMLEAVKIYDFDWKKIARTIQGRSAKQCRDRYRLKLDPGINHGPWSEQEDETLLKLHEELGRAWTKISKLLPGRTENAVKSRFSSLFRSRTKEWREEEEVLLERLQSQGLSFEDIAKQHMPHRSEHGIKKRWEKLLMKKIAKQIKTQMPTLNNSNTGESVEATEVDEKETNSEIKLNPVLAASTQSTVTRHNNTFPGEEKLSNNFVPLPTASPGFGSLPNLLNMSTIPFLNSHTLNRTLSSFSNISFDQTAAAFLLNPVLNNVAANPFTSNSVDQQSEVKIDNIEAETSPKAESTERDQAPIIENEKNNTLTASTAEITNKSLDIVRAGRLKRYSTSTTVMMQLLGEPLQ